MDRFSGSDLIGNEIPTLIENVSSCNPKDICRGGFSRL